MERLIKIGSVTESSRARRALRSVSVQARLSKLETKKEGCVWGLRVDDTQLLSAANTLRTLGIPYELL